MADSLVVYTSDRGIKFEVSKMETSHLINAITHHLEQRKTLKTLLKWLPDRKSVCIQQRYDLLSRTIDHLADELAQREVMGDEYLSLTQTSGGLSDE
jgi:hypothetical protein